MPVPLFLSLVIKFYRTAIPASTGESDIGTSSGARSPGVAPESPSKAEGSASPVSS